jgi:hypothetical protein
MSIFKLTSVSKKEGLSTRVLCVIEFPFPEENVPIHNSNKLIFSREFYFANTINKIGWISLHFSANRVPGIIAQKFGEFQQKEIVLICTPCSNFRQRYSLLRRGFNELYMALYMTLTVLNRCVEDAQAEKAGSQTAARSRSKKC